KHMLVPIGENAGVVDIGQNWAVTFKGNPLVNALAVGIMKHDDIHLANASGAGNKVVLFGARTGGDGIGGASILSSESFEEGSESKRPAVQVGDPFSEKVLI
ncbi:AIR synthase-related protein, partial [Brevibacterium paucivorans]|uniref:AIR synthase-related protein n=1 Tax=Brevibacterium paucivorans TaxID=170994 RepID=UPI003570F9B4